MEILVRGRNVDLDPAVEAATRRKAEKLPRLASDIRRVEIEFSEVRNPKVAESHRCECWTADERLWNTVQGEFPWVRWIGERRQN